MKEYDYKQIADLAILSAKGNRDAFEKLYNLTYDKTYLYACHYLKDPDLAQDALQEIYIQVLKNIDKLGNPNLFIAWLNQISFHTCYDISQKLTQLQIIPENLIDLISLKGDETSPEYIYAVKNEYARLKDAIDLLPFHEKQVIVLRFYQNMKLEEIATTLSISRSSVKRYITSAKQHLKEIMNGKKTC